MKTFLLYCLFSIVSLHALEQPFRPVPLRPGRPSLERADSELDLAYQRCQSPTPPREESETPEATVSKCSCLSRCSRDTKIIIASVTTLVATLTGAILALRKYGN